VFLSTFQCYLLAVLCRLVDSQGETLSLLGGFGPFETPGSTSFINKLIENVVKIFNPLMNNHKSSKKKNIVISLIKLVGYIVPALHFP
jgi:hypothetical protein